jgi:hypothetical protein
LRITAFVAGVEELGGLQVATVGLPNGDLEVAAPTRPAGSEIAGEADIGCS